MRRLKKIAIIFVITVTVLVTVVILCASPIVKYIVEKYDEQYSGRKITVGWVYANPFTGSVTLHDFKSYEPNGDSLFLTAETLHLTFTMTKLLHREYEISDLTLDAPVGNIIQKGDEVNFTDIINRFKPKPSAPEKKPRAVHFSIVYLNVNNGIFRFRNPAVPVDYFIKNVSIRSTGKRWYSDSTVADISFAAGIGTGDVKGNCMINWSNLNYYFSVDAKKYDLNIIEQYLKDLTNFGTFSSYLDANLSARGNFKIRESINAQGRMVFSDFHLGKGKGKDYAAFDKLTFQIRKLHPSGHVYDFDSISLNRPFLEYDRYDSLDNLEAMFGKAGANVRSASANAGNYNLIIALGRYIKALARNFFKSNYMVDRVGIYNGDVRFCDYSMGEIFCGGLSPLFITADSLSKDKPRVQAFLRAGIMPYGSLTASLSINPKDSSDFDFLYNFKKLSLAAFNPYTVAYTSFPLDRGSLDLNGTWHVRNGIIQSANHLVFLDPRVSKKLRNKNNRWLPMPLIMSVVRERGNVVDYDIPITGDLKSPKFHFHDVLKDAAKNIFIKPATTPYIVHVKNVEAEIEKSLSLKWAMNDCSLKGKEEKFLEKAADFLRDNPDAHLTVIPEQYTEKENEYLLLYEAKKKYYLQSGHGSAKNFDEHDSEAVAKMSIKDAGFVKQLNRFVKDSTIFTVQEKCRFYVTASTVNHKLELLAAARKNVFLSFFKEIGVEKQVKFAATVNTVPFNGFSVYRIKYNGEYPERLAKAYSKMSELNDKEPRKRYKERRKKIFGIF